MIMQRVRRSQVAFIIFLLNDTLRFVTYNVYLMSACVFNAGKLIHFESNA